MNINPVFQAETASDLRGDIFKIGASLCIYSPVCSFIATFFLNAYSRQSGADANLADSFINSAFYPIYSLIVTLVPIALCIILLNSLTRRKMSPLMLKPAVSGRRFAAFTAVGLGAIPISVIVSILSEKVLTLFEIDPSVTQAPQGAFATVIFILTHAFIAPIAEELLFRSVILERLRRYGDLFAVLTSALLFSLLHSSFQSYLYAFVSGVIFGLLAIWTGSALCPIIIHFINNALSVCMILLADKTSMQQSDLIYIGILGVVFIIAVAAVLLLQKNNSQTFELKFCEKIVTGKRKASILFFSLPIIVFIIMSLFLAISAVAA